MKAAEKSGSVADARERTRQMVASEAFGERFVTRIAGKELEL